MSFGSPWLLLLLLAVPALVGAYVLRERRRDHFAARWTTPALLPNLVDRAPGRLRHLPAAILLVAFAALIAGVARPHATVSVPREEATVLLAIDTSRSMERPTSRRRGSSRRRPQRVTSSTWYRRSFGSA